jgi:subtilisin family serine protease
MPMEQERGTFEIPAEFVDYRRRLIVYSERRQLRVEFDRLVEALVEDLKEFDPSPTKMEFDVGNITVTVLYLRNERRSVGEAIAQAQPRFANLRLEGDARMAVLQQTVDDPYYRQQWALQNIEAEAARARVAEVTGRPPVTVAIIDSGIKKDHEDLDPATIDGLRIIPPPPNNGFADDTGRGTMLAGSIAAVANNRKGIAGEARNVRIYALKFTDTLTPPTALAGVLGILDAVGKPVEVIDASWHVLEDTGLLASAILYAGRPGCLVVVAAGNYGSNNTEIPTLPASYGFDNMVVVMASDRDDDKSWLSNHGSNVDLAAPGERVLSTGLYYVDPAYREYGGTSAAAAHVSGAAALLLAIDDWTPQEIRAHLVASADPLRA